MNISMDRLISEDNFKRIQRVAIPLVDTLDSALSRILDFYESLNRREPSEVSSLGIHAIESRPLPIEHPCRPFDPPNLTHTKVTFARIGRDAIDNPNWNTLLDGLVERARTELGSFDALKSAASVNLFEGKKLGEGYRFLSSVNVSVQGQSANDAWRAIALLARRLGCGIQVTFYWREKDGAAYPGKGGSFVIEGRD